MSHHMLDCPSGCGRRHHKSSVAYKRHSARAAVEDTFRADVVDLLANNPRADAEDLLDVIRVWAKEKTGA